MKALSRQEFETRFPEHTKLEGKMPVRDAVQDFLDWLFEETDLCLCEDSGLPGRVTDDSGTHALDGVMFPTMRSRESIMAEFLGIDAKALEKEKMDMLGFLREQNDA